MEGGRLLKDDEGDDGAVDGGEGKDNRTKTREDNDNVKEIIDRDKAAEWENFKAKIWMMLPHHQSCG